MKRVTAIVLLLLLFAVLPAAADDVYVVQPGDTLSGIALKVYGDAGKWADLLELNPQVTDPSLIFPGDTLATAEGGKAFAISDGTKADPDADAYEPLPVATVESDKTAEIPIPSPSARL